MSTVSFQTFSRVSKAVSQLQLDRVSIYRLTRCYTNISCPFQTNYSGIDSTDENKSFINASDFVDENFISENPYNIEPKKCIICKYDIELDHKNVRLLSQFVSPYTGAIYGRHVTGLCIYMQRRIAQLIRISRRAGFMPFTMKEPAYIKDPELFDPFKRK